MRGIMRYKPYNNPHHHPHHNLWMIILLAGSVLLVTPLRGWAENNWPDNLPGANEETLLPSAYGAEIVPPEPQPGLESEWASESEFQSTAPAGFSSDSQPPEPITLRGRAISEIDTRHLEPTDITPPLAMTALQSRDTSPQSGWHLPWRRQNNTSRFQTVSAATYGPVPLAQFRAQTQNLGNGNGSTYLASTAGIPNYTPNAAGTGGSNNNRFISSEMLMAYIANYNHALDMEDIRAMSNAILQFSNRYGVDCRLVTSIVAVESSFRHDAISSSGAIGLGQLKPDTARWLGVVNPYDPIDNLAGTTRYIGYLVTHYSGDLDRAISAYYQGQGLVDREGVTEPCRGYLERVNTALSRFSPTYE